MCAEGRYLNSAAVWLLILKEKLGLLPAWLPWYEACLALWWVFSKKKLKKLPPSLLSQVTSNVCKEAGGTL